jgi:hypothetical protein
VSDEAHSEETHEGHVVIAEVRTVGGAADAGVPTLKFVHYPGAQQLILWLPMPGYQGYGDLTVTRGDVVVEQAHVSRRLNGSVQILWNTLAWRPGDYLIVIGHTHGWLHEVRLTKLEPGIAPPAPEPPPPEPSCGPIVYRDGFGRIIPDLDLQMRGEAQRGIVRKFGRRLEYEGNFRAGTIHYLDGERRISFWHEMCGGDMKFSINVPTVEAWERETGAPLTERDDIVAFVAERVRLEKASTWRFEITHNSIDFYGPGDG